jgi:NAD(P)-dependent dehydrogenase (short-subunit alcohol dehydrogenase family)
MNILLTGSNKGIGLGIRIELTNRGHRVISLNRTVTSADDVQCDFSKPQNFLEAYRAARELTTGEYFDVLINNAGICNELVLDETSLKQWGEAWLEMFQVNVFAPVQLTQYFVIDAMRLGLPARRVINICSRVGFRGQADSPHYAASKAALLNFTRSMAVLYAARNIAFYSVSPCWVATDMANEPMEQMISDIPAKTIAQVSDITSAVKFLVEDATMFMTGMNMDINGASYFH